MGFTSHRRRTYLAEVSVNLKMAFLDLNEEIVVEGKTITAGGLIAALDELRGAIPVPTPRTKGFRSNFGLGGNRRTEVKRSRDAGLLADEEDTDHDVQSSILKRAARAILDDE